MINIIMLNHFQKAGEKHKEIMQLIKKQVKPEWKASEITEFIESKIREDTVFKNEVNNGIGFPVGVSINDCCAHMTYSPKTRDFTVGQDDIVKIDFGVHQNGYIVDGATTIYFNESLVYKQICKASQVALLNAIKEIGIDKCLSEIGETIQEIVQSYEVEIDGKMRGLVPIGSLCGHKIGQYTIHDGKAVPNVKISYDKRVEEGEVYAIEPFVTIENGETYEDPNTNSHFMLKRTKKFFNNSQKKLYSAFKTLPFCDKWISETINEKEMNDLINNKTLQTYPPIYTKNKMPVAQFEKTIGIYNEKKIVFN